MRRTHSGGVPGANADTAASSAAQRFALVPEHSPAVHLPPVYDPDCESQPAEIRHPAHNFDLWSLLDVAT